MKNKIETEETPMQEASDFHPGTVFRFTLNGQVFRVWEEKGQLCIMKATSYEQDTSMNIHPLARNKFLVS